MLVGRAVPKEESGWTIIDESSSAQTLGSIYRAYASDVFRVATRLLGPGATSDDVDDVVQEVFITVGRAYGRYRGDGALFSYIYGITARVVLRYLRGRGRYKKMIRRFEAASSIEPAAASNPEKTVAQRQQVRLVWQAILRIKPHLRIVFLLVQVEGLTAPEVAQALGLSEETVRYRLRRARQQLHGQLEERQGGLR